MKGLFDLTGKVALVTGGNGGIGLGMAKGLAMHGASVVIWGNKPEKNARAVETLRAFGGEVRCEQVDVADETAVIAGVQKIVDEFGRIDTAVANAGISIGRASMFDISIEDWQRIEGINVHGAFWTMREAARHMLARGAASPEDRGGSIVSISSTSAIHGAARNEHYAATKGAVLTMTRAMAVELGRKGVRVNAILPGWVRSDLTGGLQDNDKFNANVIARAPVGRWADGDDFSAIAVYLASDHSRFHTGDSIVIDGGYTIY